VGEKNRSSQDTNIITDYGDLDNNSLEILCKDEIFCSFSYKKIAETLESNISAIFYLFLFMKETPVKPVPFRFYLSFRV
jgi:hypothetical protein